MLFVTKKTFSMFLLAGTIVIGGNAFAHEGDHSDADHEDHVEELVFEEESVAPEEESWYTTDTIPDGGEIGDFVVGPAKIEVSARPGESQIAYITVANRTGERREFNITTEDFSGSDTEDQAFVLLGDDSGPYSLRDYISTPGTSVTLDHNQRARIPVTISVPANAEPGGLYGGVLVNTLMADESQPDDTAQTPIIARIGTLFFVTVPGDVVREGQLESVQTIPNKSWFQKGPIRFSVLFKNTGSIYLAPSGTISVKNFFGTELSKAEIETWFAMPQSTRFREVVWDRENLFGRYTATIEVDRGYDGITDVQTVSFWVIPWKFIIFGFIGLTLLILIVRYLIQSFEFKRKS